MIMTGQAGDQIVIQISCYVTVDSMEFFAMVLRINARGLRKKSLGRVRK